MQKAVQSLYITFCIPFKPDKSLVSADCYTVKNIVLIKMLKVNKCFHW